MKRLAIFIGGLFMLPAFAEVAPVFYEDGIEYSDVVYDEYGNPILDYEYDDTDLVSDTNENATKPSVSGARVVSGTRSNATNRTTVGRAIPTATTATSSNGRASAANSSRVVAARTTTNSSPRSTSNSRGVASRTTSTTAARTTGSTAATRAAATRATGGSGRATSARTGSAGTGTVARTATTTRTTTGARTANASRVSRAATKLNTVVTTTAVPTENVTIYDENGLLYLPTSKNNRAGTSVAGNRASIVASEVGPGLKNARINSNRTPTLRMSTLSGASVSTSVSNEVITPEDMDELAELTDYCKAQYAACMDNYCNVLDDNQGRCSCSANIKNYAKAEAALKAATEELQEVAQKIQYIGLSAREVETLFTQTEAELKMQSTTDTSQLKTSLDKIKDMIIDVQSGNATSNSTSGLAFDLSGLLDFTIDSTGFDLTAFLGGFGTSGNTINNQRGAELFKTATNRCKANVLKSCTAQGVDASLVTNAYDLEIDKECIIYERNLNDSNDQMVATVRNAKSVLQKARLLVEQSKNEYDMRGCINALDSCMQDEYVCGSDYEKCLDPSGRYIVNGEVVIGTDPGRAVNGVSDGATGVLDGNICSMNLYNVWNYGNSTPGQTETSNCKNAWNSYSLQSGNGNLSDYIKETLGEHDGLGMSQFIQNKIGWNEKDKNYGMCMSVLNKCQDFTYTGNGTSRKYNPKNEVVKQYLDRILIQIKAKQDEILTEHAESCITDVTTCLSQNNYPFDEVADNVVAANIAINACRSTIVTCMSVNGYSVDNPTPTDLSSWICGITTGSPDCIASGGETSTETYTVTFDCWDASWGTVASITQSSPGAYITLPPYGCTPPNATQTGWKLPWVMGGSVKHAGDRVKPTGNVTIDAYYNNNTVTVTLNQNGGGSNGTLYFADNTWYQDSGKSQTVSSVPNGMRPTRSGYTFRGYTNTKQTPDITSNRQSNNVSLLENNELVINKNYGFTSNSPWFEQGATSATIYAAWAKNCVDTTHCKLEISPDTGRVTYTQQGTCPNGWTGDTEGYSMTCATADGLQYQTINLNDNCPEGGCTKASSPNPIYYVRQKGNTNYEAGKWYKVEPSESNTNPSNDKITQLTWTPTSSYPFKGFWEVLEGSSTQAISSNGTILTSYVPYNSMSSLTANWDRLKFTWRCNSSCTSGQNGSTYVSSGTVVTATTYCGENALWSQCNGQAWTGGQSTYTVNTETTCTATCNGGSGGGGASPQRGSNWIELDIPE